MIVALAGRGADGPEEREVAVRHELVCDDATLRYWVSGTTDAPVVVCTHGATLDHGAFDSQVAPLVGAGCRVVTWDLRGHGKSQAMGARFSIDQAAADLSRLLDRVGARQAVLLGQSFGGLVAQAFCAHEPDRVRGLILAGCPALGDRPPLVRRWLERLRPWLLRVWPMRHLRHLLPRAFSREPSVQAYVAQATAAMTRDSFVKVTEAALRGLLRHDARRCAGVPVLLIVGAGEDAMVRRLTREWSRDPDVERHTVEGAGHLVNQDRPAAFNACMLDFLARCNWQA